MTLTQDWHEVPGGTAAAANSLAGALSATGVQLSAVVPGGGAPASGFEPPVPTDSLRVPIPYLYDAWHLVRRPRVTSASGPVDVVHLTIPIACPRESVPMVATVHDLLPFTMPEMFNKRGVRLMTRGLERIRNEAAMVMVPSEHGREEFTRHGFDPARLRVVPLGVQERPPADSEEISAAVDRNRLVPPYVLFVGTAEPRKGLDVLLDAIEELDRPQVTLAIAGPDGWGESVDAQLGPLADRVRRLGFVDPADLPLLQAGAAVCCLPSRAEGFGLPVLEAMAAGAPVVTTSDTPMQEVAGTAALYAPAGDSQALCAALAAVLDDADLAENMSTEGRRRAAAFTWEAAAAKVVDVYDEVLG